MMNDLVVNLALYGVGDRYCYLIFSIFTFIYYKLSANALPID